MADPTQSAAVNGPQRFGKYWLDAELAEGGMSRVLRARLRGPGGFEKKLVVKQILPRLAQDPEFIELFVREANTLVQMSHPNIVPVYELGVVDGVYFLAMELVEGATVAELLRDGPLPEALCAHIGAQICEALRYAHERFGLVHCDVTPRNIIIDASGHVRLLDFGIAAPLARVTHGELFGSPGYMSPEQMRGQALSAQSDLFSLGTVLYEALTGERAVPEPERVLSAGASSVRPLAADDVSSELAALISQLLAPLPASRPSSAAEAATRFRTWLAQTHPEGVAVALGRRAEQARARGELGANKPPSQVATGPSAAPRITRSIATSKHLMALMSEGTEPLERKHRNALTPRARRLLWLLVPTVVLLATAWLARPERDFTRAPARSRSSRPTSQPTAAPSQPAPAPAPAPSATASPRGDDRPQSAPTAPAITERARLSVNALPWAELRLDGRPLGATPKRGLAVSAGAHLLELDCPPLGHRARVPLKLATGNHLHVLVDLNADPPHVTIR
jgi:serine/threonine-protein kinase